MEEHSDKQKKDSNDVILFLRHHKPAHIEICFN